MKQSSPSQHQSQHGDEERFSLPMNSQLTADMMSSRIRTPALLERDTDSNAALDSRLSILEQHVARLQSQLRLLANTYTVRGSRPDCQRLPALNTFLRTFDLELPPEDSEDESGDIW